MAYILGGLLLLGILVLVLRPFFKSAEFSSIQGDEKCSAIDELIERKSQIYQSIREIDFDRAMGKLSEKDHQRIRKSVMVEAIRVVKQLDQLLED